MRKRTIAEQTSKKVLKADDLVIPVRKMAVYDARRLLWAIMKDGDEISDVDKPVQARDSQKLHMALQASLSVILQGRVPKQFVTLPVVSSMEELQNSEQVLSAASFTTPLGSRDKVFNLSYYRWDETFPFSWLISMYRPVFCRVSTAAEGDLEINANSTEKETFHVRPALRDLERTQRMLDRSLMYSNWFLAGLTCLTLSTGVLSLLEGSITVVTILSVVSGLLTGWTNSWNDQYGRWKLIVLLYKQRIQHAVPDLSKSSSPPLISVTEEQANWTYSGLQVIVVSCITALMLTYLHVGHLNATSVVLMVLFVVIILLILCAPFRAPASTQCAEFESKSK